MKLFGKGFAWVAALAILFGFQGVAQGADLGVGANYEALSFYFGCFALIISAATSIFTWVATRNRISEERIHKIELKNVELEGLLKAIPSEQRVDGLSRSLGKLEAQVSGLSAEVHAQAEMLRGVRDAAQSINDYLLHQGKRK